MKCRISSLTILMITLVSACVLNVSGWSQTSAVPFLLNYQGKVAKTDGTPLDGPGYTISFSLYDAATGGVNLWSQTLTGVVLNKGVFHVLLGGPGATKALNELAWDKTYYLEIGLPGYVQFTERTPIVSVPYALRAQDSYTVGGKKADGTANNLPVLDGQGKLAGTVISPGTVTSDQLATKSVKSTNLDDKAVTAGKIDANAVGELQIAAGAIKAGHIGEQMVQTNHIVDGAVTFLKLAHYNKDLPPGSAAVQTGNIEKGAVTDDKISSMSADKLTGNVQSAITGFRSNLSTRFGKQDFEYASGWRELKITFDTPFPNECIAVFVSNWGHFVGDLDSWSRAGSYGIDRSGFTLAVKSETPTHGHFSWFAIGY